MVGEIGLIDAQHFWLSLHEVAGMISHDRPRSNDCVFVWVMFNSCVKVLNILEIIDAKLLKLILKVAAPTSDDCDDPSNYLDGVYDTSEQILNIIGWPDDVGVE
mgnify:CR=1 FL=1